MATTLDLSTTYSGHELRPLLVPMFQAIFEIQEGHITLHDDVNYKKALRRMSVANIMQNESCKFTPAGDVTQDEVVLFPLIKEVNLELCKNDYRREWSSARMGKGQMNKKLAAEIREAVIKNIVGTVGESFRTLMWIQQSSATPTDPMAAGGFRTQLLESADGTGNNKEAVKVIGTAIDSSNVLAEMTKAWSAFKPKLRDFKKTRIAVAANVYDAYSDAIGDQSNMRSTVEATPFMYKGYTMYVVPELDDSEIIIYNKDNFHLGTDVFSDTSKVVVKDMSEVNLDDTIRFKQKIAIDVKVGWPNECVVYSPSLAPPPTQETE